MTRTIQIGLLWHSDSNGNLGVGALTVGNMALVREAAARAGCDAAFHIFKVAEPARSYVHDGVVARHEITGRYMASPKGYWRDLKKLDLMLDIGAGDSFTDIYPDKRFAYMIATKILCRWRGVPLVLSPQTIGPFSRQPHTVLARRELEGAAAVFARDPLSMTATQQIAPQAKLFQAIDVAFVLPFDRQPKGPGVRAGINVSGLLYNGGYAGTNQYGLTIDYREFNHRLIEALLAEGVTVELITHVNTPAMPRDDDGHVADLLKQRYPAVVRVPGFASPSAAKSHISGLDWLAAGRMHASIAAYSAGVPVLPVSYSRKFEGLYQSLDWPWMIPNKGFSTDEAVAYAMDSFRRREAMIADFARGHPAVEAGCETYIRFLADLICRTVQA